MGPLASIASNIFQVFGIFKQDEKVDEMGDRVLQAGEQGIEPKDFSDHEAYMDKLREFKLDPEKSEQFTPLEKVAAGLAVGGTGIEKKLDIQEGAVAVIWPLVAANPEYFNPQRLQALIEKSGDISAVMKYFSGSLGATEASNTEKTLVGVEKSLSPNKDEKTIFQELDAASNAVQALDK